MFLTKKNGFEKVFRIDCLFVRYETALDRIDAVNDGRNNHRYLSSFFNYFYKCLHHISMQLHI